MTYYVSKVLENGDKTCIEAHSYRDAKKWAKDWGGNVEVICEQKAAKIEKLKKQIEKLQEELNNED